MPQVSTLAMIIGPYLPSDRLHLIMSRMTPLMGLLFHHLSRLPMILPFHWIPSSNLSRRIHTVPSFRRMFKSSLLGHSGMQDRQSIKTKLFGWLNTIPCSQWSNLLEFFWLLHRRQNPLF